jgi:hypothetical protein
MGPLFVVSLITWFALIVGLLFAAARITDRRPRLAFALLMTGLMVMVWGLVFVMTT